MDDTLNSRTTWFKNKFNHRSHELGLSGWEHARLRAPELISTKSFPDRIWSTPSLPTPEVIMFGCYDNHIYAVNSATLETLWKLDLGGTIYSSCTFDGFGGVVVGSDNGVLWRITAAGEVIWRFQGAGSFHGTPTVVGDKSLVVASCYDGHVYSVDLQDGGMLWKAPMHPGLEEDVYSSPALGYDGAVVFGTGNSFVRLDQSGSLAFAVNTEGAVDSTAALDFGTRLGVIGCSGGRIYLFDFETGEVARTYDTEGEVNCSAAISQRGIACIGSDDGFLYGIELENRALRWKSKLGTAPKYTAITTCPTDDFLLVGIDGVLRLIDSDSGSVLWQVSPPKGAHSAPLIASRGRIYLGSHFGDLYQYGWANDHLAF